MTLTTKEKKIFSSIVVASENDPTKPEFPPWDPKYPSTPTYKINVPGFSNVWVKDESHNPTGTHKDRLAWEVVVTYKNFLQSKKDGLFKGKELPQFSIITSGSAGFAIQSMLNRYNLPSLKCLVDIHLDEEIVSELEELGCEIYRADLSRKSLDWKEILALTHNQNGIDITSNEALDPTLRFYDWMSYDIVNQSPDYCFIPFGTGNLYENILNINKRETLSAHHDPRFKGDVSKLKRCNFIGATVNNVQSKADKLYSPHLPFVHFDDQWIRVFRDQGSCGSESGVFVLDERYLDEAIKIARKNNIEFEPSGIAGLGMLLQMKKNVPADAKILIVSTGKAKCKK